MVGVSVLRPDDVPATLAASAATATTSADTRGHRVRKFKSIGRFLSFT
jgi:hypothetical protein